LTDNPKLGLSRVTGRLSRGSLCPPTPNHVTVDPSNDAAIIPVIHNPDLSTVNAHVKVAVIAKPMALQLAWRAILCRNFHHRLSADDDRCSRADGRHLAQHCLQRRRPRPTAQRGDDQHPRNHPDSSGRRHPRQHHRQKIQHDRQQDQQPKRTDGAQ
jgi:hypothetical protein